MDLIFDRNCAVVNLKNIKFNAENIKKSLPDDTGIVAVVKADAYGHGADRVFKSIENIVSGAAVASVDEGVSLRKITDKFILVLGYSSPYKYREAIENDITLTVFDEKTAKQMSDEALKCGKILNVHIAVDTGMRRIGFLPTKENAEIIKNIQDNYKGIKITGIFTHFATADEADVTFSDLQYKRFTDFVKLLENMGVNVGWKHISNSALIMQNREKFDLVRAGIILYGLYPSEFVDKKALELLPAMTFVAHVARVFTLKKGEGISYGQIFVADSDRKVATISAGYADGVFRSLSNKGFVLIHGKKANILGRVCMDQMMVDVTDIPETEVGDIAEIFGEHLPVETISELAGSFNYEMICNVSRRVPRLYIE